VNDIVGYEIIYLVGRFNPPEKYESQIGSSSQLLGKIKNVPNHQPIYPFHHEYFMDSTTRRLQLPLDCQGFQQRGAQLRLLRPLL
jgi:hypothetical protein